jgi:hypothetical protein
MGDLIPWLIIVVGFAVIIIHFNLWRLLDEQKRHNQETEGLLKEVRDRLRAGGPA